MKAAEGKLGRVFMLRLEHRDEVPSCIERFAAEKGVRAGFVLFMGGIDDGEIVVGPRRGDARPPDPMRLPIEGAHEAAAVGVLAPKDDGTPVLHIHGALGRAGSALCGCFRPGVNTWVVGEAVLYEVLDLPAVRRHDEETSFSLLDFDGEGVSVAPPPAAPPAAEAAREEPGAGPAAEAEEKTPAETGGPHSGVLFLHEAEIN